ncbi:MAG TPA: peptidoglycan DD-metalloendopeptidase family protein [Acidobacteriota bacterium]|nr:peptidoglycan DD-metalloendopeptidase family protein [Acidobacteriota bacterium]
MNDATVLTPLNQIPANVLNSAGNRLESKLQALQGASGSKKKDDLKKVSQEFEAIFIAHLLKVMRETVEDSGLLEGGFGKSIYTEMFDQEVSLNLAKKGTLGISNLLYQSLSKAINDGEGKNVSIPADGAAGSPSAIPSSPASTAPDPQSAPGEEISDLQLPVQAHISSAFGMRKDPFSHQAKFHKGLDLSAPEGMKVVPALQGKVVFAGYMNGYGNTVVVQHSGELQTRYGHLGSIAVKVGDVVDSQNILGTVGSTGRSTGPHLHFEVIRNGVAVNPATNLNISTSGSRPGIPQKGV